MPTPSRRTTVGRLQPIFALCNSVDMRRSLNSPAKTATSYRRLSEQRGKNSRVATDARSLPRRRRRASRLYNRRSARSHAIFSFLLICLFVLAGNPARIAGDPHDSISYRRPVGLDHPALARSRRGHTTAYRSLVCAGHGGPLGHLPLGGRRAASPRCRTAAKIQLFERPLLCRACALLPRRMGNDQLFSESLVATTGRLLGDWRSPSLAAAQRTRVAA